MIKTARPPHFPTSAVGHGRGRAPPHTNISVKPTATAGVLAVKPNYQQRQPRAQKTKPSKSPKLITSTNTHSDKSSSAFELAFPTTEKSQLLFQSHPAPRGRQQGKPPKSKFPRTPSVPRRNNARQPSPPIDSSPSDSPAPQSNLFDPFLANYSPDASSGSESESSPVVKPALAAQTIHVRRKAQGTPTRSKGSKGSPTASIAVPRPAVPQPSFILSASGPEASHMPLERPTFKRSTTIGQAFPICNDQDLIAPIRIKPSPATPPTRVTWQQKQFEAPSGSRTAPLSSTGFSFAQSPPSSPRLAHKRSPSEFIAQPRAVPGMIELPVRPETTSPLVTRKGKSGLSKERSLPELGATPSFTLGPNTPVRPRHASANAELFGKFASSMFQNSPDRLSIASPSNIFGQ